MQEIMDTDRASECALTEGTQRYQLGGGGGGGVCHPEKIGGHIMLRGVPKIIRYVGNVQTWFVGLLL